ncbi:hypothetical protein PAHAL_5G522000 [Panicum hallii]|uniref:Uncharacterized protein n=1 Tax=Panicum hallii TaxID=206008 RepID=A0A2S3HZ10_9POAL|nr:hypothetical protein PAHAL_5G522000 [Panicum hallii]
MQAHCRPHQLLADANASTALYDERKNEDLVICVEYNINSCASAARTQDGRCDYCDVSVIL